MSSSLPAPAHPSASAAPALGSAPGASAPTRLLALDALRGAAILLVLAYHFVTPAKNAGLITGIMSTFVRVGWVGVDLFFVLSGFLITGILLDGDRSPGLAWRFYGRRALRILPLYYVTIGALLVLAFTLQPSDRGFGAGAALVRDQAWYWLHAANLSVARAPFWSGESWIQHFWSLAVEEQFYLVWPAVVLLVPRARFARVIGWIIIGALFVRCLLVTEIGYVLAAHVLTPARADALAAGAFLALAWRTPAWHARTTRAAVWIVPTAAVALVTLLAMRSPFPHGLIMSTVGHTVWALLFAALLWLALVPREGSGAPPRWAAAWRPWLERREGLHLLARYSYGLYVVHLPIAEWLRGTPLGSFHLVQDYGFWLGNVLGLGAGIIASSAVAVPLWHLMERPVLQHGGARLDRWIARRSTTATAPGLVAAAPAAGSA